jgi:hypothetical protein
MPDDPDSDPIPTLPRLIFGEAAPAALGLGSPRLAHWSQAFEAWLDERRCASGKTSRQTALRCWASLPAPAAQAPLGDLPR